MTTTNQNPINMENSNIQNHSTMETTTINRINTAIADVENRFSKEVSKIEIATAFAAAVQLSRFEKIRIEKHQYDIDATFESMANETIKTQLDRYRKHLDVVKASHINANGFDEMQPVESMLYYINVIIDGKLCDDATARMFAQAIASHFMQYAESIPNEVAEIAIGLCGDAKTFATINHAIDTFSPMLPQDSVSKQISWEDWHEPWIDYKYRKLNDLLRQLCMSREKSSAKSNVECDVDAALVTIDIPYTGKSFSIPLSFDEHSDGSMSSTLSDKLEKWSISHGSILPDYNKECKGVATQTIAVVPSDMLTNLLRFDKEGKENSYVDDFLDRNILDAVISLPAHLANYTSLPISIIRLRNGRKADDPITFIDATDMLVANSDKRILDVERVLQVLNSETSDCKALLKPFEVRAMSDNIMPERIVHNYNRYAVPDGYRYKLLDNYSTHESTCGVANKKNDSGQVGKIIHPTDLNDSPFASPIDINTLSEDICDGMWEVSCPAVIVSLIGALRPNICNASAEMPVFIGKSMCAITTDESEMSLEYLALQLSKLSSEEWRTNGMITRSDMDHFPILVPQSLNEQKLIYDNARSEAQRGVAVQDKMAERIKEIENDIVSELRMRRHDMKPYIMMIGESNKLISLYIEKQMLDEKSLTAMLGSLQRQSEAIKALDERINRLTDDIQHHGEAEVFCLSDFLKQVSPLSDKYVVNYSCSPDVEQIGKINIKIYPNDMKDIVSNILSNAERHGFTDKSRTDYRVDIHLSLDAEGNNVVVDFCNNGKPMPEGMSAERFGIKGEKAGVTAGTGLGGYRIKDNARRNGGDFDVISSENGVTIRLVFPIV